MSGKADELISKQDATRLAEQGQIQGFEWQFKKLCELPSAEPERKKGKWISLDDFRGKYNENGYKCSECGEPSEYEENYCPNCGVDMRGEHDE